MGTEKTAMEAKVVYFENSGGENTETVLRIAKQRADLYTR